MPYWIIILLVFGLFFPAHSEGAGETPPVAWRVELLSWDRTQGDESVRVRWRYAIVLQEQRGIGLSFFRIEESRWRVGGIIAGQVTTRPVAIRLDPNQEVRLTAEDDLVFAEGSQIGGRAERVLVGRDDAGVEVRLSVVIPLRGDPPLIPQIPSGETPPAAVRGTPSRIPIRQGGTTGLVVHGLVNGRFEAALLLDTGATNTIFSPRALGAIGVPIPSDAPRTSFIVAGGQRREAPVVRIDSLELGDARVSPLDVLAFDVTPESSDVDGVVGLDFLSRFTVTIDQASGNVLITPRP